MTTYADTLQIPVFVLEVAEKYSLSVLYLDYLVNGIMGWEPHQKGFERAVIHAANCIRAGRTCS